MGTVGSKFYKSSRRLLIRFNAENRALKFLEKNELPRAPRHDIKKPIKDITLSREILEEIHCKDIQLNEHLKKVYLISTSEIFGTPSKRLRPKPKKEDEVLKKKMFYEPEVASPNHCTLTNVVEILLNFQNDSDKWNVNAVANRFNLKKKDVVSLIMFYSIFKYENLDFLNQKEKEEKSDKIEFEVYTQLEKKPVRHLDSK